MSSQLQTDSSVLQREIIYKTTWILLAVAINAAEFFIPRIPFFPWLKPGLANCVTILWIIQFGIKDALLFSLLRIWITGFYFGFSLYAITLSLSGGICSTLAMGLAWAIAGKKGWLGTVGAGIIGAVVHNFTQIVVIYFLFAKNERLFYQVPLMLVAAIVFGGITGACALTLLNIPATAKQKTPRDGFVRAVSSATARKRDAIVSVLLLAISCVIVFISDMAVLVTFAMISALFVQLLYRGSIKVLLLPVSRFWPLFLFIACVHCFLSYGTRIELAPFFTYEGVRLTGMQWLKLWIWLNLSFSLTHFNFHHIVLTLLRKLFPRHESALFAGILALEYFPATVSIMRIKAKNRLVRLLRHPISGARTGLELVYREVERQLFESR